MTVSYHNDNNSSMGAEDPIIALNKSLIQSLVASLLEDPEVDLESLVASEYRSLMQKCNRKNLDVPSKAAQLNRQTIT